MKESGGPKEFLQRLEPLPAEVIQESADAFIFMDVDTLEAERKAIAEALPPYLKGTQIPPSAEQGFQLADSFSQLHFGTAPETGAALSEMLSRLPSSQIPVLDYRLRQLRKGIWNAVHYHGADWDSTRVFAVPPVWSKRWELLLGGQLLPAYVAFFDVRGL